MMTKELGWIKSIRLGPGGYQDRMFGLTVELGGEAWVTSDFQGYWSMDVEITEHTKWSEKDRQRAHMGVMVWAQDLLRAAKKRDLADLKGAPIEATFENGVLKSWRILEEVLP